MAYASHDAGPPLVFVRGWISHLDAMWDDPEFRPFLEALGAHFTVTEAMYASARAGGAPQAIV